MKDTDTSVDTHVQINTTQNHVSNLIKFQIARINFLLKEFQFELSTEHGN